MTRRNPVITASPICQVWFVTVAPPPDWDLPQFVWCWQLVMARQTWQLFISPPFLKTNQSKQSVDETQICIRECQALNNTSHFTPCLALNWSQTNGNTFMLELYLCLQWSLYLYSTEIMCNLYQWEGGTASKYGKLDIFVCETQFYISIKNKVIR